MSLEQKEEEKMNIPNHTKLPNRRPCITTDVGEGIAITVSYHPEQKNQ